MLMAVDQNPAIRGGWGREVERKGGGGGEGGLSTLACFDSTHHDNCSALSGGL